MDLIKLSSTTAVQTHLDVGQVITGYTSVLWVERYRDPGEFKIEAPLSSGLMDLLPLGSFITHLRTSVLQIVENHEISQPEDEDPTITITGRSFQSYLEERTAGDYLAAFTSQIVDYTVPSNPTWDQVVEIITSHITAPLDANDGLDNVDVTSTCTGASTSEERVIKPQNVHQSVLDILKVDDLGLKSIRPTPTEPDIFFVVYRGENISAKVRFSQMRGDLSNVEYFFSNKKYKTQIRVMGRWVQKIVNLTGSNKYNRRTMILDASDIDEQQPAYPSGLALGVIEAAMEIRGRAALRAQMKVSIVQADVSDNTQLRYREDYDLGDLVTVDGDFGASVVMRVIEFAEADDETGSSGHPTLAIPGEY